MDKYALFSVFYNLQTYRLTQRQWEMTQKANWILGNPFLSSSFPFLLVCPFQNLSQFFFGNKCKMKQSLHCLKLRRIFKMLKSTVGFYDIKKFAVCHIITPSLKSCLISISSLSVAPFTDKLIYSTSVYPLHAESLLFMFDI